MRLAAAVLLATAALAQELRTFERVVLLEETAEDSAGAHVGDVNGDGRLDIVLAKGRHGPLHDRVLLNDGKGGFVATDLGKTPDRTYSAALADIDRDGDLDIIVSNDEPDPKKVYFNDSKGRFTESGTFGSPGWSTRYVTLADLNGDRYPDIVAANRGVNTPSYICLNDRKGAFPSCEPLPPGSATSIVAADLDGDGAIDLYVPHRDHGQSVVLWNDGKGKFGSPANVGPADATVRIGAAADFDGDGKLDLAVIDEGKKAAYVIKNLGGRKFGDPVRLPGPSRTPYALAIADLNRDKRPDLVVGWVQQPGSVYYNGRDAFHEIRWNDGKGVVYGMDFADFDGDGWLDIVAARSGAQNGIWYSGKAAERADRR